MMLLKYKLQLQAKAQHFPVVTRLQVLLAAGIAILIALYFTGSILFLETKATTFIAWYRGNSSFDDADFGQAEIYYNKALEKDKGTARLNYNLGNTYYEQGRYNEAIAAYSKALATTSVDEQTDTWNNIGNAQFMAGNLAASTLAYRNALLLNEGDNETRQNFVYVSSKLKLKKETDIIRNIKRGPDRKGDDKLAKNKDGDDKKGEKDNSNSPSEFKLTNKTIDDLFKQIDQNQNKVRGRISKAKLNNDLATSGPDY